MQCPTNQVVTGAYSYHSNHYEDRRWAFRCSPGVWLVHYAV
jgi:hypothetical protein